MRFSLLAFVLVFAAGCQSAPPPAPPAPRMLDHATQIEMPPPSGYAFSRDGRTLIFSADDGDGLTAFSIPLSGDDEPTALTNSNDARAISYFPSDDRILLQIGGRVVVRERDETTRDLGAGAFMGWCADGSLMIGSPLALSRIDVASYERRDVRSLPATRTPALAIVAVSRDCRWAAMIVGRAESIRVADLDEPEAPYREVEHVAGATYAILGFTPTNQSLNFAQREGSGFAEAYRYALADGQFHSVMETQADVLAIEFSPTGRFGAYYSGVDGRITDVAVVDHTTERTAPLSTGTRDLRFNRDETRIAFRLANDDWPNDIFIADTDGGHIVRLVHAPRVR